MLRNTPKPLFEITVINEAGNSCPRGEIQHTSATSVTPVTPVTPMTTKTLTSLHNLIKQKICAPNKLGKQRIQRYIQKLASAAQIFFAKQNLLQNQNRFLCNLANKVKVRRSTKSIILEKAKVMSYEDLEEARARRVAKKKATSSEGKRGHKRRSSAPEPSPLESMAKLIRMSQEGSTKTPVAPLRAPVARMH